jgi:hypothetical protein
MPFAVATAMQPRGAVLRTIEVHNSLLHAVLHEKPQLKADE